MVPPQLQFDFLPRRRIRWFRPALVLLTLMAVGGFGTLLARQHAELLRTRDELSALEQKVANRKTPVPRAASAPWEAQAAKDAGLFELPVDARLLELERCVTGGMSMTGFRFDAPSGVASTEVQSVSAEQITELMDCLNQGTKTNGAVRVD